MFYRITGFLFALALCAATCAPAQTVNFTGKVTDRATQQPIPGALIKMEGSTLSTLSAADGSFQLNNNSTSVLSLRASPALAGEAYLADGRLRARGDATVFYMLRPVAPRSALAKPAAQHVLDVSKSGYVTGPFRQFQDTGKNLNLALYAVPPPAAYAEAKQACLDTVNAFRKTLSLAALTWSTALEAFADSGAHYDSDRDSPHAHFGTQGKTLVAFAENELPGWGFYDFSGSMTRIAQQGTKDMWAEGPGGGHYENIKGKYTLFGCGIYINASGDVWVTQDFR